MEISTIVLSLLLAHFIGCWIVCLIRIYKSNNLIIVIISDSPIFRSFKLPIIAYSFFWEILIFINLIGFIVLFFVILGLDFYEFIHKPSTES